MCAQFAFFAGEDFVINNLTGSGLGLYGNGGFSFSVEVGAFQDNTFITDGNGVLEGPQADNIKFQNSASGIVQTASSGISITAIPNHQATLRINFNHDSLVKVQNTKLRIYDRANINNDPSGVTCKVAELIHPNTVQDNTGSGDTAWNTPTGSSSIMDLVDSPGVSGFSPNGTASTSLNHDWYCALSASPDSIGSKTQFGLFVETEFL